MNWYQQQDPEPLGRVRARTARRGAAWAALSAVVVLAVTWTVNSHVQSILDESARKALGARGMAVESAASVEVGRYLGVLTVVADGLAAFDGITEAKFRSLTAGIDSMGLNGATSVVYIAPPVATADVAAAQRRWRESFTPDLELKPTDAPGDHVFSLTSVSLDGAPDRPSGTDVTAAAAPYAALMESRRSEQAAVSDAYQLLIDQELPEEERQTSFSLVTPIERDGEFLGWVLMGLRGQDFLGHVLEVAGEGRLDTVLEAGDSSGLPTSVARVDHQLAGTIFDQTQMLDVAQQEWTLRIESDEAALLGPSRLMPRNIRIGGTLLTMLVAGLAWGVVTGRARSAQLVLDATAELAAAEAVSRRQASLLDAMLQTIDDVGVSVIDHDGRFLLQSRAAREILGVVDDDGGRGPHASPDSPDRWQENFGVFHPDGTPMDSSETPLVRALDGESIDAFPMLIRNANRPDGVELEVSGRPLVLGDGRHGGLAVFRDVTLEKLQRAELTGFAGVVAHDLRHPLTVISGYVGLLTDDCLPRLDGDPELLADITTYLGKISVGVSRMAELISDLLEYTTARDTDMTWRPVDLRELGLEVAAAHADTAGGQGHPVPYIHLGDLPVVEGDPDRLRQLFSNLIGNAVKYVTPGAPALLDVTASTTGDVVRLRFADRGIGIPADKRGDVFRPFVRAHTGTPEGMAYTGTGLGLAICHQVVRRHGGDISVQDHPGGGTVFVVELPCVRPSAFGAVDRPSVGEPAETSEWHPVGGA